MTTQNDHKAGAQASAEPVEEAKTPSNLEILGEMCRLYSQSRIHRTWAMGSLQQWLLPAILTRQMRMYRKNGKPHAFVTWARLSQEVEEAFVLNTSSLQPKDWQSGDRIWFLDWIGLQLGHRHRLQRGQFRQHVNARRLARKRGLRA